MTRPNQSIDLIRHAGRMLRWYVEEGPNLFGLQWNVYTYHQLLHITADVERYYSKLHKIWTLNTLYKKIIISQFWIFIFIILFQVWCPRRIFCIPLWELSRTAERDSQKHENSSATNCKQVKYIINVDIKCTYWGFKSGFWIHFIFMRIGILGSA